VFVLVLGQRFFLGDNWGLLFAIWLLRVSG
jgi:hypothetical protein